MAYDDARLFVFDQCCYDTRLLGELIKKPTKILTNLEELCGLHAQCDRSHSHAQLQGRTLIAPNGKRVAATKLAAA